MLSVLSYRTNLKKIVHSSVEGSKLIPVEFGHYRDLAKVGKRGKNIYIVCGFVVEGTGYVGGRP